MTLTAAAIRMLAEKGLSALDIADVADAMQPEKTTGAVRQQRYRDNKRNVTRNVTPPIDNTHTPQDDPIEAKASIAPRGRKPKTSHRLPDDWQPEPLTGETEIMVSAWEPGRIERELSKFKDYWKAAAGRSAVKDDWQAALRYWLRNSDERGSNGTSNRSTYQSGKPKNGFAAALRHVADGPVTEPFGIDRQRM